MAEGGFFYFYSLFCVVGVVCVRCNKQTHFVLGSAALNTHVLSFEVLDDDHALAGALGTRQPPPLASGGLLASLAAPPSARGRNSDYTLKIFWCY